MARLDVYAVLFLSLWGTVAGQDDACEMAVNVCNPDHADVPSLVTDDGSLTDDEAVWYIACQAIETVHDCVENLDDCPAAFLEETLTEINTIAALLCVGFTFDEYRDNVDCYMALNDQMTCELSDDDSCSAANDYVSCFGDTMADIDECSDSARDAMVAFFTGFLEAAIPDCQISGGPAVGPSWHLVAVVAVAGMALLAI